MFDRESFKRCILVGCAVLLSLSFCLHSADSKPVAPFVKKKSVTRPDKALQDKADRLYYLVRAENRRLEWDDCLAQKAFARAMQMVNRGYFEHIDPRTGRNPAWNLVESCFPCRYAGENLAKGDNTAEATHQALMDSPTHRKNILDRRFRLVGIACYDYICVQLFAGF